LEKLDKGAPGRAFRQLSREKLSQEPAFLSGAALRKVQECWIENRIVHKPDIPASVEVAGTLLRRHETAVQID
jgi:hypothetical protein